MITHHTSATIQSAELAMEQFGKVPVRSIDSESVSLDLGLMVIAAARTAEQGIDAKEVLFL